MECHTRIHRSARQSLWKMARRLMRVPTPFTPWSPEGESLSQTEKTEAHAGTLETQF